MKRTMRIRSEGIDSEVTVNLHPDNEIITGIALRSTGKAMLEAKELAPLKVMMPCGYQWLMTTYIPSRDIPCACGDPNHWFFRLTDKADDFVAAEYP